MSASDGWGQFFAERAAHTAAMEAIAARRNEQRSRAASEQKVADAEGQLLTMTQNAAIMRQNAATTKLNETLRQYDEQIKESFSNLYQHSAVLLALTTAIKKGGGVATRHSLFANAKGIFAEGERLSKAVKPDGKRYTWDEILDAGTQAGRDGARSPLLAGPPVPRG